MGNKQAEFRQEVDNLFNCSSQAEFGAKINRIMNMYLYPEELRTHLYPMYIRKCIEQHKENFENLFQFLIDLIRDLTSQQKNISPIQEMQLRNSLMMLTKFLPVLYEEKYSQIAAKLLWSTGNNRVDIVQVEQHQIQGKITIIKVDEDVNQQEVGYIMKPNILVLLDSLVTLCFSPGFTILRIEDQQHFNIDHDETLKTYLKILISKYRKKVDLNIIWRGFAVLLKYPNDTKEFWENRIIVLQCMLSALGYVLYRPKFFTKDTKSTLSPIVYQKDQFNYNESEIYPYKTINLVALFLSSHQMIDELIISFWATILFNKQSFFWLQENPLFIKREPRILANLCGDINNDLAEIVRQMDFNYELAEAYKYLQDKLESQAGRLAEDEDAQLQQIPRLSIKKPTQHISSEEVLQDCTQLFTNHAREIFNTINDEDFLRLSIIKLKENIRVSYEQESQLLSAKSTSLEGSQEFLGLLYYLFKYNSETIKEIVDFVTIILYNQVKFIERRQEFNIYLICLELMIQITQFEKVGKVLQEEIKFSIPLENCPNFSGTYGDFIIQFYSYLLTKHFEGRMKDFYSKKSITISYRPDIISLILFNASIHIRNLSPQAAYYLSKAFYCHLNYEYLLQDPLNAYCLYRIQKCIFNILCIKLETNLNLLKEMMKQQDEMNHFLNFTFTKQHLNKFFLKMEKIEINKSQASPNQRKPGSYLNTEKSEAENKQQIGIQSIEVSGVHHGEEQKQQTSPKKGIQLNPQQLEKYNLFLSFWVDIFRKDIISNQQMLHLKKVILLALELLNSEMISSHSRFEEFKRVICKQCWVNILDPSMIVSQLYDVSYNEPDFKDYVMSCALMRYEWLPQFQQDQCFYFMMK